MGAYFDSIVVPGAAPESIRDLVVRWMSGKGFDLAAEPPILDQTEEWERGAVIASDPGGTVLLLSNADESDRVLWELQKLGKAALRLWLIGSDVWGYQLVEDGAVVASFSSNANYF